MGVPTRLRRRPQAANPSEVEAKRRPPQYERLPGIAWRDAQTKQAINRRLANPGAGRIAGERGHF